MSILETGKSVFKQQAKALTEISEKLDKSFELAVKAILDTQGRVIVSGMGKSGIVGKKIAAILASTGTPSLFIHPGEAFHGDLGMVQPDDLIILISFSGETEEVIRLLPSINNFSNKSIAIVGSLSSTLSKHCDYVLNISIDREVCPNNLAPTTSTAMTIAMGDALAVALMDQRSFKPNDFAKFHPGGSLGKKLLTRVRDVMSKDIPLCKSTTTVQDAITAMTQSRMGVVLIEEDKKVIGIFTDGDLRRAMLKDAAGMLSKTMSELMTANPKTISQDRQQKCSRPA